MVEPIGARETDAHTGEAAGAGKGHDAAKIARPRADLLEETADHVHQLARGVRGDDGLAGERLTAAPEGDAEHRRAGVKRQHQWTFGRSHRPSIGGTRRYTAAPWVLPAWRH
jgi:hypothetical protein